MGTTTKLTFEEFQNLPEGEGTAYELDQGELLMVPSPALRHNLVRQRIALQLMQFVESHRLGVVVEEMDFLLGPDTIRNPGVALISTEHLKDIDIDRSPVNGAPALAIEVISPTNRAEDTARKIRQFLEAGCRSVWIVYPGLRIAEIHSVGGVREIIEPETLKDEDVLPGFSLSLSYIFDGSV
jgi:Uma2 family endonuclease